jgi:hypothetical protein
MAAGHSYARLCKRRERKPSSCARASEGKQPFVGETRDSHRADELRVDAHGHEPFIHRRRAAHGMVPIHVAVHLVLGEQQRFQRGQSFFVHSNGGATVFWV